MATKVFFSNKGLYTLPRGDNNKINENILTEFQSPLPQNHRANFNQTWHKAFWGNWDSSLFNVRPLSFPRRSIYEIAKIHRLSLKMFLFRTNSGHLGPRTTRPVSPDYSDRVTGPLGPCDRTTRTVSLELGSSP